MEEPRPYRSPLQNIAINVRGRGVLATGTPIQYPPRRTFVLKDLDGQGLAYHCRSSTSNLHTLRSEAGLGSWWKAAWEARSKPRASNPDQPKEDALLALHRFAAQRGAFTRFFQFARVQKPREADAKYVKYLMHFLEAIAMVLLGTVSRETPAARQLIDIVTPANAPAHAIAPFVTGLNRAWGLNQDENKKASQYFKCDECGQQFTDDLPHHKNGLCHECFKASKRKEGARMS